MKTNQPYLDRAGYFILNGLLITAVFLLFLCLNGCTTYSRFLRKFGHVAKDSVTITVTDTVRIPKDSVVLQLRTDTTTVRRIVEQGRARIIYDRTKEITRIQAECKADTLVREVKANCPPVASFGVAPWYQWAFFVTLGLLLVAVISYVFLYKLKLSLTKR